MYEVHIDKREREREKQNRKRRGILERTIKWKKNGRRGITKWKEKKIGKKCGIGRKSASEEYHTHLHTYTIQHNGKTKKKMERIYNKSEEEKEKKNGRIGTSYYIILDNR